MFLNKITVLNRVVSPSSLILSRNFAFKSDLKIKWIRPEKVPVTSKENSGDLDSYVPPEQTRYVPGFEQSEELKNADDLVKKLFSLEQNRRISSVTTVKQEMIDLVKRHDLDLGSFESRIAKMTAQIRAMQDYYEKFPRNTVVKVQLKELIEKRKKFLRYLRVWDYRRFEWILEKLNLVYKPYPEQFIQVARKDSLRKLTDIHCEKLRQERLDLYRKELESKQLSFLENKIKNLEFIRNEQIECKVPVTVTVEQIQEVKKQYQELKVKREEEEEINKKLSAKEDYELNL